MRRYTRGWKPLLIVVVAMLLTPRCAQPERVTLPLTTQAPVVAVPNMFETLASNDSALYSVVLFRYKTRNVDTCFLVAYKGGLLQVPCP